MITLVTGTPGGGKTLWTVKELVKNLIPTGRDIYTNIKKLSVPDPNVHLIDSSEMRNWEEFPDGSIFIFDECQHYFPPRHATSKVPSYIEGFQTHRHRGLDFYLITQEPSLIDKAVRVLVGRHVHLYRPMGLPRSQVFEWPTVNPDPNPAHSSSSAKRTQFVFPKDLFGVYESASIHTHKLNLPWGLLAMIGGALFVLVIAIVWFSGSFIGGGGAAVAEPVPTGDPQISEVGTGSDAAKAAFSCVLHGRVGSMYLISQDSSSLFAISGNNLLELCSTVY